MNSRLLLCFGLLFYGLALFDCVMGRRDIMTYCFLFLGVLASVVFAVTQSIENRLNSIEKALQSSGTTVHTSKASPVRDRS